jgi:hypothetical protein
MEDKAKTMTCNSVENLPVCGIRKLFCVFAKKIFAKVGKLSEVTI